MPRRSIGVVLLSVLVSACADQSGTAGSASAPESSADAAAPIRTGVSLSPRSFEREDFTSFFEDLAGVAEAITWSGSWRELAVETSAPHVLMELAEEYGYEPIVVISTHTNQHHAASGGLNEPYTEALHTEYVEAVRSFVDRYRPAYLGIGVELNRLATISPTDYADSVALFRDAVSATHGTAPATMVFTALQLEWMHGLQGGAFGGRNDLAQAQWELIADFDTADIIAFTTYPSLVFAAPGDIPDDHYTRIREHVDGPIAFSEVGWPAADGVAGVTATLEAQTLFVDVYRSQTAPLRPIFEIWAFHYDQAIGTPFGDLGLMAIGGDARPARDAWFDDAVSLDG